MWSPLLHAVWLSIAIAGRPLVATEFKIEKSPCGATVKYGDELVTEYHTRVGNKPVLWPLKINGHKLTRGYPIEPTGGDSKDHEHQCGLWFDHGDVNAICFWNLLPGSGQIVHREFTRMGGGPLGTLSTRNDWLTDKGKKVCSDLRSFRFWADGDERVIDVDITVLAEEGDLYFNDNKEGSFGVRLAESMRVDAKQGGRIVSSEGLTDEEAWGKPARWVDYQGPVGGETVGVAIIDHPRNLNSPTRWHVRDYGLFAANPFSRQAFDASLPAMKTKVAKGGMLKLQYRVVLHTGDEKAGRIEHFAKDYLMAE